MSISDPAWLAATATTARYASARGDADAVAELLAPDVVFHSPLTARIRFDGRAEVEALHRDIFAVLDDLHTSEAFALGDTGTFSFRARVRGMELEAMNVVRCNEQGQIVEIKVFAHPLPSIAALFATLPPRVSTRDADA